jgi:hypothetical protein
MFKNAYETTPCSAYNLAEITKAVQEAKINGELEEAQSLVKGDDVMDVYTIPNQLKDIGAFAHPLSVKFVGSMFPDAVVLDTRAYTRRTPDGKTVVTNVSEYNFQVLRGRLQKRWTSGAANDFLSFGALPLTVFARWIAEAITRRLGLSPAEQMRITIIAGMYYLQLFQPDGPIDADAMVKLSAQLSRAINVQLPVVLQVTDQVGRMTDIRSFIATLTTVMNTPRLEKFSAALLYAIMGSSWFGANPRETVAVALEHPPTYLTMVYTCLTDRSVHKCFLAELVARVDRQNLGKQFVTNLTSYLESPVNV